MKNLDKLFQDCLADVVNAGIETGNIISVSVNSRAKKRWGLCRYINGYYEIEISNRLLADNIADIATKNTIVHEILHTVKGCMNHGDNWQKVANRINEFYNGYYTIQRTTAAADKGIEDIGQVRYDTPKWALRCIKCGKEYIYRRAGKAVKSPENYRCGCCHGHLTLIKI